MTKVSIIIPVLNAGEGIDLTIESLATLSAPIVDHEVILVDDCSSDEASARLREFERRAANVRVVTVPNDCGPSTARNAGLDHAEAEFALLLDPGAVLTPESLDRLYTFASEYQADVVIPAVTRAAPGASDGLRPCDRTGGADPTAPFRSLTPDKLIRRSLLDARQIRFPTSHHCFPDALFMLRTYLAAGTTAVLTDHVCYRDYGGAHRGDGLRTVPEPKNCLRDVGELFDVIDQHPDAPMRDAAYAGLVGGTLLDSLADAALHSAEADYAELFTAVSSIVAERFPASANRLLDGVPRARVRAVMNSQPEVLRSLVRAGASIGGRVRLDEAGAGASGLRMTLSAHLTLGADDLALTSQGEEAALPGPLLAPGAPLTPLSEVLGQAEFHVVLTDRDRHDRWQIPGSLPVAWHSEDGTVSPRWSGSVTCVPVQGAAGRPLEPGSYEVGVRLRALGVVVDLPLRVDPPGTLPTRIVFGNPYRCLYQFSMTGSGDLRLQAGLDSPALASMLAKARITSTSRTRLMISGLPFAEGSGPWTLVATDAATGANVYWTLACRGNDTWQATGHPLKGDLYQVALALPTGAVPLPGGPIDLRSPTGRFRVQKAARDRFWDGVARIRRRSGPAAAASRTPDAR